MYNDLIRKDHGRMVGLATAGTNDHVESGSHRRLLTPPSVMPPTGNITVLLFLLIKNAGGWPVIQIVTIRRGRR
jgi:hypothetical protein